MAQKLDYSLPFNDLIQYVPQELRNTAVKGLIDNLFNRQMTRDESIPYYGYIGQRPTSVDDKTPKVQQDTVERDLNGIVPVLNFMSGSVREAFTVQDLLNKARVLGVNSVSQDWLYSQSNNYLPPIDIRKFAQYYNYFWVANALPTRPSLSWNTELKPEYYTIARPKASDLVKMNVVAATTSSIVLTGTGFKDQVFTITFTSPTGGTVQCLPILGSYVPVSGTSFTLNAVPSADGSLRTDVEFKVSNGGVPITLVKFTIQQDPLYDTSNVFIGHASFDTGDVFTLTPLFLSLNYTVSFTGSSGVKGKIVDVYPLNQYQTIDGVQISNGERVLVKDGTSAERGIWIVKPQGFVRAEDFNGETAVAGARVWVQDGVQNKGKLFTSISSTSWGAGVVQTNNTNEWQEGNFWVHGDDLGTLGLTRSSVTQATRPIIEYHSTVELNTHVQNGLPSSIGTIYEQQKTEFNQLPMFNLYRYDGTHAGKVSSVFYYVEDLSEELDVVLQKRVKHSSADSSDFLFDHGLIDDDGDQLFYKQNNELKSIWHAGYTESTVIDFVYAGNDKGKITNLVVDAGSLPQTWTLTAISATEFSVFGDSTGAAPTLTVGVPYSISSFSLTITNGTIPFVAGESFVFNSVSPNPMWTGAFKGRISSIVPSLKTQQQVWILTATNSTSFDVRGSKYGDVPATSSILGNVIRIETLDFVCEIQTGTIPFEADDTFVFRIGNIETPRYITRDDTGSIHDLYGGSENDTNGVGAYSTPRSFIHNPMNENRAEILEGTLYAHFLSILNNQLQGMPTDYAFGGVIKGWSEQHSLLASLLMQRDLTPISLIDEAQRQYESALGAINEIFIKKILQQLVDDSTLNISDLVDVILEQRASDYDVRTVLFDSTSPVLGFPATLPQLRVTPLVEPKFVFDSKFGEVLLEHHDGHRSQLQTDDTAFLESILDADGSAKVTVNGVQTNAVGSVSNTVPSSPHVGMIWVRPGSSGPTILRYEGPNPSADWVPFSFAEVLNTVLLEVETRLFRGMNPAGSTLSIQELKSDQGFVSKLQGELFSFAAKAGLDPLGTDYLTGDAFTWNYKTASYPTTSMPVGATPARWYNVLKAHQSTIAGVIPTERPNLEPWKLLGHQNAFDWADYGTYASTLTTDDLSNYTFVGSVSVVSTVSIGVYSGLPTIDLYDVLEGDKILLTNEPVVSNNGVWIVHQSGWSQMSMSVGTYVLITNGSTRSRTYWVQTSSDVFEQARLWKEAMWAHIVSLRPGLKLSVDVFRDELMAPYINSTVARLAPFVPYSITNLIPSSRSLPYFFDEGSPVQTFWENTIGYRYSIARALFKYDPVMFLGFCWGTNWAKVDDLLFDAFDLNLPGHRHLKLHGEYIEPRGRSTSAFIGNSTMPLTLVYDAYEVHEASGAYTRYQNFSVRDSSNEVLGTVRVNTPAANVAGVLFGCRIVDSGKPYRIGDKFEVNGSSWTFVPTTKHLYLGFGQTFAQALRQKSIDPTSSYAVKAYREWDVHTGHRAGSLVSTNDLKIRTDDDTLSSSSYELILKKNSIAKDLWVHALRITVSTFGVATETEQGFIPSNSTYSPAIQTVGADWTFRIEGYNPLYAEIVYHSMDTTSGLVSFHALEKSHSESTWYAPTKITGTVRANLPLKITGIQNVLNFLFGYKLYLENQGWMFNHGPEDVIDYTTNRVRGWQLEIEKFVDRCYIGIRSDEGMIVNPFQDRIWVKQETGLLSKFSDTALFDVTADPGVFDVLGNRLLEADLYVTRGNLESEISGAVPMYSAHAQLDEYEHLFIFNRYVEDSIKNGTLYEPFSGARVGTFKVNGRRQAMRTLRPEMGGYYISNGEVRQNLQASTDNVQKFFDANHVFENDLTSRHALALLGFNTKQYFNDLDITDKSQFNFWRGLIQAKGTNLSIDAYLNNNRFEDAQIDEYWAYKVAEYGDARERTFPELKLFTTDTVQQFTQFQFAEVATLPNFIPVLNEEKAEARWFSFEDLDEVRNEFSFSAEVIGEIEIPTSAAGVPIHLPFVADELQISDPSVLRLNATTVLGTGGAFSVKGYGAASNRYTPVKLLNYIQNELVQEIPFWHPATGKHTPAALESINVISNVNPARVNYSTLSSNNPNYDPLRTWGSNEVGRVWFDTRDLAYIPYYDAMIFPSLDERLNRWGALADYASVNVYEWVKSTVPPSEYNDLAKEQAGDADLDSNTKAVGEVALQETYKRDRLWNIRPILWSNSSLRNHPTISARSCKLFISTQNEYALEIGTFEDRDITTGMRIGAWDDTLNAEKPLSEAEIVSFKAQVYDSASDSVVSTFNGSITSTSSVSSPCAITVESIEHKGVSGPILFEKIEPIVVQQTDANGTLLNAWSVDIDLKATEVDNSEFAVLPMGTFVGLQGPTPETPPTSGKQTVLFGPVKTTASPTGLVIPVPGKPATPATPLIPAVPATNSKMSVLFTTAKVGTDLTGFVVGQTYTTWITLTKDVSNAYKIQVEGVAGQTVNDLLAAIQATAPVTLSLIDGNITIEMIQSGVSIIQISDVNLFSSLSGFSGIGPFVQGTNAVPEKPAQPGTPAVDAVNGSYTTTITINGVARSIIVSGEKAQTFDALITEINKQFPSGAPVELVDGDIVVYSRTTGASSTVQITPVTGSSHYDLFSSLNDFASLGPSEPGTNFIPAAPAPHLFGATMELSDGEVLTYTISEFGLKISVQVLNGGVYSADAILNVLVSVLNSRIVLRDAAIVTPVVEFTGGNLFLDNTPSSTDLGWAAWSVPTQEELDNDSRHPNGSWKPYVGDFVSVNNISLQQIQDAVAYSKAPLTLNSGLIVQRYKTEWTDWEVLLNQKITAVRNGAVPVVFHPNSPTFFDDTRTSVYVNGVAQLAGTYVIDRDSLTPLNISNGSALEVIIRKYEPTTDELKFDPSVQDDLTIQTQYKKDYEYVSSLVRDSEGALSTSVYYFWVKNKTTAAFGKKLSIAAISHELKEGPSNYLTFQNIQANPNVTEAQSRPFIYDAITISDLSYIVGKDETFKLRFLKDFTLRDDPEELNLKNVHTEWTLIRAKQRTRIPEALWMKLTDSLAGEDVSGNAIPSLRRTFYDERNGTTTKYGFNIDQALAPRDLLISSVTDTIVNTKLLNTYVPANSDGTYPSDFIEFLNLDQGDAWIHSGPNRTSESNPWFGTAALARETMTNIWTSAKTTQINEIFFVALNDILAANLELTDLFKTSRLSAYSIKVVSTKPAELTYE